MKTWIFTYTEDNGKTYKKITTEEQTYSKAYIKTLLNIAKSGMITDYRQIKQRYRVTKITTIKYFKR